MHTVVMGHCHIQITLFWGQVNMASSFIITCNGHELANAACKLKYLYSSKQTLHCKAVLPLFVQQKYPYLRCYVAITQEV